MTPSLLIPLGEVIIVAPPEDIDDEGVESLIQEVTRQAKDRGTKRVVVDLSSVEVVDTYLARRIERLARTLIPLDASVIIAGLSVPVVLTLLDFDIHFKEVSFALNAEQAVFPIYQPADSPSPTDSDL